MKDTSFYMIYVEGGISPAIKHSSYEEAENEAKRLAQKMNKPVYVLKTYAHVVCIPQFKIGMF